ncbi:hypothetical protein M8C21_030779 [Ambrosia artemisiifolia]|uniref:Uncharacterized protein n=1 Tax=Ambrosia artemisiifolia TaxID=4212 RepID=A0AAD5BY87_AMBAR|nr:hypothetical protein M8C21_030779 [Ambrosia artemisiifolia]
MVVAAIGSEWRLNCPHMTLAV